MNFAKTVQLLIDGGVDFVIIGGWSAILHGSGYVTNDFDICYSRKFDNLKRLARVLAPYHPRLRGVPPEIPFVWDEVKLRNTDVLTLSTDLGIIELLAEVSGIGDFNDAQAHSVEVAAFERTVRTLDLPGLIRAKRAAGRGKDLRALPELESLLETCVRRVITPAEATGAAR